MAAATSLSSGRQPVVSLVYRELDLNSQIARFALEVKGVSWKRTPVTVDSVFDYLKPWSARFNPSFNYPVLFVGNLRAQGLKDQFRVMDLELGAPTLIPDDSEGSVRCNYWVEEFTSFPFEAFSHMWATGVYESLFDLGSLEHLEAIEDAEAASLDLASDYQALREGYAQVVGLTQDDKGRAHLEGRLCEQLLRINRALAEREFLAGDELSAADIVWSTFIARLEYLERPLDSFGLSLDEVSRWYERIKSRPDFAAAGVWDRPRPSRVARQYIRSNKLPLLVTAVLGLCGLISLFVLASSL